MPGRCRIRSAWCRVSHCTLIALLSERSGACSTFESPLPKARRQVRPSTVGYDISCRTGVISLEQSKVLWLHMRVEAIHLRLEATSSGYPGGIAGGIGSPIAHLSLRSVAGAGHVVHVRPLGSLNLTLPPALVSRRNDSFSRHSISWGREAFQGPSEVATITGAFGPSFLSISAAAAAAFIATKRVTRHHSWL